jgi:hypothetical protein
LKKVLILAYDFPPYVSVGGLRPYNWYKQLKKEGFFPVVVTRQWVNRYGNQLDYVAAGTSDTVEVEETEEGMIIRTPYFPNWSNRLMLAYGNNRFILLRKFLSFLLEFFQWFFILGPKAKIYRAADEYLKRHGADVIIATGDPFILFKYARMLGKKYDIPWVADYRDPWSHNFEEGKQRYLSPFYRFVERHISGSAAFITTAAEIVQEKVKKLQLNTHLHILYNGFEQEIVKHHSAPPAHSEVLCIAYAGTVYDWHPWNSFFRQLYLFKQNNPTVPLQLNFYGNNRPEELKTWLRDHLPDLQDSVIFHPKLSYAELIPKLAENHVFLLFNDYYIRGTKIYDYLGLKRHILFCYLDDVEAKKLKDQYYRLADEDGLSSRVQADLIEETQSGTLVRDADHLREVLSCFSKEFLRKGNIACHSINTERYSREFQVKKLAELIRNHIR